MRRSVVGFVVLLLWSALAIVGLPGVLWAACTTSSLPTAGAGATPPRYFVCATVAELPASGLLAGDLGFAINTGINYKATGATTWAILLDQSVSPTLTGAWTFQPGPVSVASALGSEQAPALTAGNWTVGSGWESPIVGPGLIKNADGVGTQTPSAATTIVAGTTYKVIITLSAASAGSASYTLGSVTGASTLSAVTTYTDYIVTADTTKLIITPTNTSRFTISAVSVKALSSGTSTFDGLMTLRSGLSIPTGTTFFNGTYTLVSNDPAVANFFLGSAYSYLETTGHDNLGLGLNAAYRITTGIGNLGIGHSALSSLTTGTNNVAIGWDSQFENVDGVNNVTLGVDAFKHVTSGVDNVGIGTLAGQTTTTGSRNIAIGVSALYTNVIGTENVAIGRSALTTTTGIRHVAIGDSALAFVTTGNRNVAVGAFAGTTTTTGSDNVFIGYAAGYYETGTSKLFIDDRARTNEAQARTAALLYGDFASTPAAQQLTINGVLSSLAGGGTQMVKPGGSLYWENPIVATTIGSTTWVNNTAYTIPGGTLGTNGDQLYLTVNVKFDANAGTSETRNLKCNVGYSSFNTANGTFTGGLNIVNESTSTASSLANISWFAEGWVTRTGATALTYHWYSRWEGSGTTQQGAYTIDSSTITWASNQLLLCAVGNSTGSNTQAMTLHEVRLWWNPR